MSPMTPNKSDKDVELGEELRSKVATIVNDAVFSAGNKGMLHQTDSSDAYQKDVDHIMQALTTHIQAVLEEVIGEDQVSEHKAWDCPCGVTHSMNDDFSKENNLRAEQRQRAAKYLQREEE